MEQYIPCHRIRLSLEFYVLANDQSRGKFKKKKKVGGDLFPTHILKKKEKASRRYSTKTNTNKTETSEQMTEIKERIICRIQDSFI